VAIERVSAEGALLAARYLEKKARQFSDFCAPPPLPVSPGSPEVDPMIDQNRRTN